MVLTELSTSKEVTSHKLSLDIGQTSICNECKNTIRTLIFHWLVFLVINLYICISSCNVNLPDSASVFISKSRPEICSKKLLYLEESL